MIKKLFLVEVVLSAMLLGLSTNASACVASGFTVDNYSPNVDEDVTVTFDESSVDAFNNMPDSWIWNFGEDAVPATADTKGPHVIHYTTEGVKTITLNTVQGANTGTSSQILNAMPVVPISIASSLIAMLAIGGGIFFKRKRAL